MRRKLIFSGLVSLFVILTATPIWAQATRTWVSGVGDDANPCSRTAPCKTFAGAISKTAAGGEINVLDPGGFGAVTITKAITISSDGFEAGVLVSGTNGIVISAGASDKIILRGLDIEGLGTGLDGIKFLAGGSLAVEKCTIEGFTQSGINFNPSGTSKLFVEDTIVRNNNPTGGSTTGGIFINPSGSGKARVSLNDVRIVQNFHGLRVQGLSSVAARNTVATGNTGTGFFVTLATTTDLNLDGCEASDNANGVRAEGTGILRMANTLVTSNTANGVLTVSGGQVLSWGNNRLAGNAGVSSPTSTILQQ